LFALFTDGAISLIVDVITSAGLSITNPSFRSLPGLLPMESHLPFPKLHCVPPLANGGVQTVLSVFLTRTTPIERSGTSRCPIPCWGSHSQRTFGSKLRLVLPDAVILWGTEVCVLWIWRRWSSSKVFERRVVLAVSLNHCHSLLHSTPIRWIHLHVTE
jgi:hypothetical protein